VPIPTFSLLSIVIAVASALDVIPATPPTPLASFAEVTLPSAGILINPIP